MDVSRDTFGRYAGDLGNLRLRVSPLAFPLSPFFFFYYYYFLTFICFLTTVERPSLSKLHRDRVHRARLHIDRDFHSLVSLRRLAKWGLGPNPSEEALAHEITVRKSKF